MGKEVNLHGSDSLVPGTFLNPEDAVLDRERIKRIRRLSAVLNLRPTPEEIFLVCTAIKDNNGPGVHCRKDIAVYLRVSEEKAQDYEEWAMKMLKLDAKSPHASVLEFANLSTKQIHSGTRRLHLLH